MRRIRQHVNPLALPFRSLKEIPSWEGWGNAKDRLHLDLGAAKGELVYAAAQRHPTWKFVGVDVRDAAIEAGRRRGKELGILEDRVRLLVGNPTFTAADMFHTLGDGDPPFSSVSIYFPDPCFKRRLYKRRLLQPELMTSIAPFIAPGAIVAFATDDWPTLALGALEFARSGLFDLARGNVVVEGGGELGGNSVLDSVKLCATHSFGPRVGGNQVAGSGRGLFEFGDLSISGVVNWGQAWEREICGDHVVQVGVEEREWIVDMEYGHETGRTLLGVQSARERAVRRNNFPIYHITAMRNDHTTEKI